MLGLYLLVKEDIKETLIKEHEKTNKVEEKGLPLSEENMFFY